MNLKELTENMKQFRLDWHNRLHNHQTINDGMDLMHKVDGMSWDEIDEFVDVIAKEEETGVYFYPPVPITNENLHLHMVEPDDSWMFAI